MARKDDVADAKSKRRIDKSIAALNKSIGSIYQSTYGSREDNRTNTSNILSGIDDNIDDILNRVNNQNVSNIASLYTRAYEKEHIESKKIADSLEELFDASGNFVSTLNTDLIRRSIQAQDRQYDLILKYMPKVRDALSIKKDNVLSSDSFTKDCISITTKKTSSRYTESFSDRAEKIKEKYKFEERVDEIYDDCQIHGEYFLYHVPYKKAFQRLLDKRDTIHSKSPNILKMEGAVNPTPEGMIFESANLSDDMKGIFDEKFIKEMTANDGMNVSLKINESGIIESLVNIEQAKDALKRKNSLVSLVESFETSDEDVDMETLMEEAPDYVYNGLSSDGTIDPKKKDSSKLSDNITGSISYKIPRDQIVPVWMGESLVGYLYLEIDNTYLNGFTGIHRQYDSLMASTDLLADEWDRQNDLLVSQIAGTISEKIDAKFINANLDLKSEIYSVLRYNEKFCSVKGTNNITCTFIPAEDIQHFYFKLDPKTHRGISDLEGAVIPAMIWCMAYLNDAVARVSRGSDKRVYYVQQYIEKNVSKTLLNVINQLKKGNMGMRQLENMNTMFNIIGKFNDHIIPVGNNGESPIRMEVLNGQQIDTPTELMDRMEETTLYSLDVPPEFVNSINQVDYAIRFTMSNSNFLKKITKRQMICQRQYSITFRKYYNYEYDEHDNTIIVRLPLPAYLATINTAQLLENAKTYATGIAELVCSDNEKEGVKEALIRLVCKKFLATYIDFDEVNELLEQAKQSVEMDQEIESMGNGTDDFSDDDGF